MEALSFWLGGTLTVTSGMLAVTRRNAVASVMWLVAAFIGMEAAFIGVIQILVYAGAILVLFLFVIMLLNLTPSALVRIDRPRGKILGLASAGFFVAIIVTVAMGSEAWTQGGTSEAIAQRIGKNVVRTADVLPVADQLFDRHLLPFEVASILLLIAILGAVVLTKRKV